MDLQYLFAGFAVFWAGLFVYLLLLQARLRSLTREMKRLEERLAEAETSRAPALTPAQHRPGPATDPPATR